MAEHNLPDKDDAPWLDCMDGFKDKHELRNQEKTREYPIAVPSELIQEWINDWSRLKEPTWMPGYISARASQWGYLQHEQELLKAMHSIVPQPYESDDDQFFHS